MTLKTNPAIALVFSNGELFTTFHGRPEGQTIAFVDVEADKLIAKLTPEERAYAGDPKRGSYRGYAALHDHCDANMLLPFAQDNDFLDRWAGDDYPQPLMDFWNAVMDKVTISLIAWSEAENDPIKQALVQAIEALLEFADNGTPIHPGALVIAEARAALKMAQSRKGDAR